MKRMMSVTEEAIIYWYFYMYLFCQFYYIFLDISWYIVVVFEFVKTCILLIFDKINAVYSVCIFYVANGNIWTLNGKQWATVSFQSILGNGISIRVCVWHRFKQKNMNCFTALYQNVIHLSVTSLQKVSYPLSFTCRHISPYLACECCFWWFIWKIWPSVHQTWNNRLHS